MDAVVLVVFAVVYLGMLLGEIPGLALDRTGVALLGAIGLIATGRVTLDRAWQLIDVPTIGLLFGLMVVSAQFRLGGFYARFTLWLSNLRVAPGALLAVVITGAAVLSALLANDIVCLAMTPLLAEGCARRKLDPVPYLLALACASNVGSAATLIGNPQNMLIGQALKLSFATYLAQAAVPTVIGLLLVWIIIYWQFARRWHRETEVVHSEPPRFQRWQTTKGTIILTLLIAAFLFSPWPREVLALTAAGVLLTSRKVVSSSYFALVDWNLLILFAGLFIVNGALQDSGMLAQTIQQARDAGIDPAQPAWLFGLTVVLSNLVSNVPATMLLLPVATHKLAGPILALSSTLAGNLLVVGSIANIIVIDQAKKVGVSIGWKTHASVGIPVTVATLVVAALWLWWCGLAGWLTH